MSASLQPGDKMSFRKTLTVAEQAMYTGISGNLAPLYVDQRAAREAGFDATLAFELNGVALATTALNRLAGPAWRLGALQIDFLAPVLVGQTIESSVEVTAADAAGATCRVRCALAGGAAVAEGTARLVPVAAGR
ncbi:MaoC family dehydratase [Variovorax paradoxus]|uniref:Bifunctional enoyl-CoA hydratase/phosphate acetyltransferase n=1 Tax=Variovorax paradoxus TaxID=34073 RepID=A0A0H2LW56_VARPD|nr:MaoC/PaaZ C-terminal domain-containing protein [Variovorax paradoxus]KLN53941.1 bifunctional enoyl-CoA hydratase/phosphate acetyltransferase [Variovorax paradoxus]